MGSGKSVVGALVAKRANVPFHDLDRMIEDEAGMTIAEIFASSGEAEFRNLESRILPRALEPGAVVALGGGTVVNDANWRLVADRAATIYLELPFATMWGRVSNQPGRPLASDRSMEEVKAFYESRRPRYEEALYRVDGDRPPAVVADEVIKLWSA